MKNKVPNHVAIIPDGNRRWAKGKGLEGVKGHAKALEIKNITALLDKAKEIGIGHISIWGFSTENWKRSVAEKKVLFELILGTVNGLRDYAHNNNVRIRHIGRKDRLPKKLIKALKDFEKETKGNDSLNVQLLLDYGGRDDIVRAVGKIVEEGKEVDEESFLEYLDTKGIPEPDLIIRTGGDNRLSGFLSYQMAYSELYFTETYFPDFGSKDLVKAVEDFGERKRRFGGD